MHGVFGRLAAELQSQSSVSAVAGFFIACGRRGIAA
jgi:hypothetical protein